MSEKEKYEDIINLLANMITMGASKDEMLRMIEYSMAVIDERKSYVNNKIGELVECYG